MGLVYGALGTLSFSLYAYWWLRLISSNINGCPQDLMHLIGSTKDSDVWPYFFVIKCIWPYIKNMIRRLKRSWTLRTCLEFNCTSKSNTMRTWGLVMNKKKWTNTVIHASISTFDVIVCTKKKCFRCDTNEDLYRNYRI